MFSDWKSAEEGKWIYPPLGTINHVIGEDGLQSGYVWTSPRGDVVRTCKSLQEAMLKARQTMRYSQHPEYR